MVCVEFRRVVSKAGASCSDECISDCWCASAHRDVTESDKNGQPRKVFSGFLAQRWGVTCDVYTLIACALLHVPVMTMSSCIMVFSVSMGVNDSDVCCLLKKGVIILNWLKFWLIIFYLVQEFTSRKSYDYSCFGNQNSGELFLIALN